MSAIQPGKPGCSIVGEMSIANGVEGARLKVQRSRLIVLGAVVEGREVEMLDVENRLVEHTAGMHEGGCKW